MRKKLTLVYAIAFLVVGIAALIPALSPSNDNGQLILHIFQTNTGQTIIHFASAIAAFAAFAAGAYYSTLYLRAFGIVYTLVAVWGLPALTHAFNGVLFGAIHVNAATEVLHIALGLAALYGGFVLRDDHADAKA